MANEPQGQHRLYCSCYTIAVMRFSSGHCDHCAYALGPSYVVASIEGSGILAFKTFQCNIQQSDGDRILMTKAEEAIMTLGGVAYHHTNRCTCESIIDSSQHTSGHTCAASLW